MKKFTLIISILLITVVSSAQQKIPPMGHLGTSVFKTMEFNKSEKVQGDTLGWSSGIPLFGNIFRIFVLVDATQNPLGYWFGSNFDPSDTTSLNYWAQCYLNDQPIIVAGALAIGALKHNQSLSNNSVLEITMYNLAADQTIVGGTSPNWLMGEGPDFFAGSPLATSTKSINNIDTIWEPPHFAWNYFPFTTPVSTSSNFALIANFSSLVANSDTVAFPCDSIGDGMGLHFTQYSIDPMLYYWVSTNFATNGTLDVNMALFAVLTDDAAIAEGNSFYQGMKMTINPNPVSDIANIAYELQFNSNTKIDIISINGQLVRTIDLGFKTAGYYTTSIDMTDIASGMYFISLNAHGSRLIKQVVVE